MIKLRKGQRVRITHVGSSFGPFEDYGKVGVFVSMLNSSYYYFYVEGSANNKHRVKDRCGNAITWQLLEGDFVVIGEQLLFNFMYDRK